MAKTPATTTESPADKLKRETLALSASQNPAPEKEPKDTSETIDDELADKLERESNDAAKLEAELSARNTMTPTVDHSRHTAVSRLGLPEQGLIDPATESKEDRALRRAQNARGDAMDKLNVLAASIPLTTPNEHVLFGLGGRTFTVGELRVITGQRS